jgi:hypothetical protein
VELTIEQHAEAHRVLFEQHGRWQDELAWEMLSGRVTGEEGRLIALREGIKNRDMSYVKTPEYRAKMSAKLKGRPYVNKKGPWTRTKEANEKISRSHQGNQYGVGNRGNYHPHPLVSCPHCDKQGKGPVMKRYHFDNCKSKE